MSWESRYLPPDPLVWHGRIDVPANSCFYQHIRLLNLLTEQPAPSHQLSFAILGFKCDEGVARDLGRTGAVEGPLAIRQRLARLPLQKTNVCLYDAGNIICTDHDLEASQAALAEVVALLLAQNIHPIILGGGHEVSWGHYQGLARVYPTTQRLGIVNFDAHFDLHSTESNHRGSSMTAFYQIAEAHVTDKREIDLNFIGIQPAGNIKQLFDTAKKFKSNVILAEELHQGHQEKCVDFIDRVIDQNQFIYVSLSLDVFAPAFAPGVNATQPLGLHPWHIIPLIRELAASGKVVSYDIAEHVPRYDIDHRTAKLAATLIYEIIHHHSDHDTH